MSTLLNSQRGETCCVICEQFKGKGIYLYTSFICSDCEKGIISTETSDPQYKFYLKKMRKINAPEIYS